MNRKEAEHELEFLETSPEALAAGLRRIKRRHYTGPPDLLPQEGRVTLELSLDAEVVTFFERDTNRINRALRSAMERGKTARELLDDADFVEGLKKKLAA